MSSEISISGLMVFADGVQRHTAVFNKETGLITRISDSLEPETIHYSDDCLIYPGFGDIHIHAREDVSQKHIYKENFSSAGFAALNGGVTHVADMPNNPVPPVDSESYFAKQALTLKSPVHITLYAGIGPTTQPLSKPVPYKVFMGPSIGELFFRTNEELEAVISRYRNQNVSFHCEDPVILEENKGALAHEDRRPAKAEVLATEFALYLIEKYNLSGKLCHYSTADGLTRILDAKKKGINVTCEVTPTHLYFDRTMITTANHSWLQMNPPLREPRDKKILLDALKNGDIEYLATDHAPHSKEEKLKGISGVSHLDTYGLFVTWLLNTQKVSVETIRQVCSVNPGKFVNPFLPEKYGKGFGEIQPGFSAGFSILNLKKPETVVSGNIRSNSGWSPFEGVTFPGSVEDVWFHGVQRSGIKGFKR